MQIGATLTCRAKIKLGGREPAAWPGRRDKADFSPTRAPTETLLQTSHICLPSRQRVQLGLATPFGKGCQTFYNIFRRSQDTPLLPSGSPMAPAWDPAQRAGAGSRMCPGRTPPAGAGGMQHIPEQVLPPLCSGTTQETRDFQGKNETPPLPFCRGDAGSGQLCASHRPAGRLGWLRGHSARGSGGFGWSRRGCQTPALQRALPGTPQLTAGCRG